MIQVQFAYTASAPAVVAGAGAAGMASDGEPVAASRQAVDASPRGSGEAGAGSMFGLVEGNAAQSASYARSGPTRAGALGAETTLTSIQEIQPDLSMYGLVNVTGGLLAKQSSPGNRAANLGGDGVCAGKVVNLALRAKRCQASSESGLVFTKGRWDAGFAMRGQGQYEDRFRTLVQIDEPSTHDVMCVAVDAMKRAVSIDAPTVRVAMPSVRFHNGSKGAVAFDDKGDMKEGAITVHDFKGGGTAVLEAMSA